MQKRWFHGTKLDSFLPFSFVATVKGNELWNSYVDAAMQIADEILWITVLYSHSPFGSTSSFSWSSFVGFVEAALIANNQQRMYTPLCLFMFFRVVAQMSNLLLLSSINHFRQGHWPLQFLNKDFKQPNTLNFEKQLKPNNRIQRQNGSLYVVCSSVRTRGLNYSTTKYPRPISVKPYL